jgi:hypothetical protein
MSLANKSLSIFKRDILLFITSLVTGIMVARTIVSAALGSSWGSVGVFFWFCSLWVNYEHFFLKVSHAPFSKLLPTWYDISQLVSFVS